jgi:hypothetical protein
VAETVLGGVLLFSGLLLAGLAKIASGRLLAGRRWADRVAKLSLTSISKIGASTELAAIRGTVEADEVLTDPVTDAPVVFYEVHAEGGENVTRDERDAKPFFLRDATGVARVDPEHVHDLVLTHEIWQTGDDRKPVARYLKKHALANVSNVRIEHSAIAPDKELLVVGRPTMKKGFALPGASTTGYRDGDAAIPSFEGGDTPLVLATTSLDTFVEREVASAKKGTLGVLLIAALGFGSGVAGAVLLVLGLG